MTPDAASPASDRLVTTISFAFLAAANASGSPAVTYETSASVEEVPREGVGAARFQPFAERHDRPLVAVIDQGDGAPGLVVADRGVHRESKRRQPAFAGLTQLIVAERREQVARPGELRELHGGDGATACRFIPRLGRVHDLAGSGHAIHEPERDPLHMTDHCDTHPHSLSGGGELFS